MPGLKHAFRRPEKNGWTFVHLEGTPHRSASRTAICSRRNRGRAESESSNRRTTTRRTGSFFRDAAQNMMWPHIEPEYREELQGIADGANAKGVKLDVWDVVALNAAEEWEYYVKEYNKEHAFKSAASMAAPEHCSAFVATGSYTQRRQDRDRAQ